MYRKKSLYLFDLQNFIEFSKQILQNLEENSAKIWFADSLFYLPDVQWNNTSPVNKR